MMWIIGIWTPTHNRTRWKAEAWEKNRKMLQEKKQYFLLKFDIWIFCKHLTIWLSIFNANIQ